MSLTVLIMKMLWGFNAALYTAGYLRSKNRWSLAWAVFAALLSINYATIN